MRQVIEHSNRIKPESSDWTPREGRMQNLEVERVAHNLSIIPVRFCVLGAAEHVVAM